MNRKRLISFLIIALILTTLPFYETSVVYADTPGTVYYVDFENGDDNNPGTSKDLAWKHAPIDINSEGKSLAAKIAPGDTILFRSDVVYRGKMLASSTYGKRILGSGVEGNPITLKGDGWGDGKAIIDGSELITGWTRCESADECVGNGNWENIWYADVPPEWAVGSNRALTLNLYQGEQMMNVAQYPDQPDAFYFDDTSYFAEADNLTETWLEDDALADMNLSGSYLGLWGGRNDVLIRKTASFDPLTNRITYEAITNPYGRYTVLNSIDTRVFNRQGEVYFDEASGKLYIWPFDNVDPNDEEISISIRSDGIELWGGNDYITIEGFIIQKYIGRGICWPQSPIVNGCVIRKNQIRYCRSVKDGNSIHVGAMLNALVEENEIYKNAGPLRGIGLSGGSGHIVRNNTVRESGRTGVYFTAVNNGMILYNTVIDNKGKHSNGISVYGNSQDILVAGNQVYNSNIAFTMEASTDIYLYNNIFIGSSGNMGISVWSGQNGMHLYHNLVSGWYLGKNSTNINSANNIIIGTGSSSETENMDLYLKEKPAKDMSTIFRKSQVVSAALAFVGKYESLTNVSIVYLADEGYENIITPGNYLRYDQNSVHQITAVSRTPYKGNNCTQLVLNTPVAIVEEDAYVEVWKDVDDFEIDYHLFDGSIAVNRGIDISELIPVEKFPLYDFSRDIEGSLRVGNWDIGPYEFVPDTSENLPPAFDPTLGDKTILAGTSLVFTVTATDPDNDSLTYSVDNLPGWVSFDESTGIFSGTPGNEDTGEHSITFIVTDNHNPPVEKLIKITVQEVPDKITIMAPSSVGLEQEFTVDVGFESIDEELKVLVADIGIAYDADSFDYLGYTKADDGLDVIESNADTPGELRFVLANTGVENAITDAVSLIKLNFKSRELLGSGIIDITFAEFSAVGKADESIPYTVKPDLDNITVSVINKIPGDIDNNGTVDTNDPYYVCYYYEENEESANWNEAKKADVSGDNGVPDGKVDIVDLVYVAKKIIGKE